MKIDYRALLKKYMVALESHEGINFVSCLDKYDKESAKMTDEEYEALCLLVDELEEDEIKKIKEE